eukprot:3490322-Pyramimonas_sp.AAC.1
MDEPAIIRPVLGPNLAVIVATIRKCHAGWWLAAGARDWVPPASWIRGAPHFSNFYRACGIAAVHEAKAAPGPETN